MAFCDRFLRMAWSVRVTQTLSPNRRLPSSVSVTSCMSERSQPHSGGRLPPMAFCDRFLQSTTRKV